ncbi:MAG: hypothetical protein JXB13_15395 [Phycisphaerae bacterium]|nr:hypothetical protein [Phycisphaerae bacterium]
MEKRKEWSVRLWISVSLSVLLGSLALGNPYADVDWARWQQHRANLHTHTTLSDGQLVPAEAIDRYRELGYTVLALTDHDTVGPKANREDPKRAETTWPWQRFDRDPAELGMVAIEGNEISKVHHTGSYFTGYGNPEAESPEQVIEEIGQRGGLAVMCHPGRYDYSAEWYAGLFSRFTHLVGLEVCNRTDRYPGDIGLWDEVLQISMPDRPVWGFANDDMHRGEDVGRSWEVLLLPEHTAERVREAMTTGRFYFSTVYEAGRPAPTIKSIRVDEKAGTITIEAENCQRIYWISCGRIVYSGPTFDAKHARRPERYVRAQLRGEYGYTFTQPFRLPIRQTTTDRATEDESKAAKEPSAPPSAAPEAQPPVPRPDTGQAGPNAA